jgi:type I restriction-modification system DNA methylase subunit
LYNNRSLFSDYYLRELVRDDPHWKDVLAGVSALRQRIADIYRRGMPGIEQASEAEVERRLIRPVLDALAHVYEAQPNVRSAEGTKTPDYGIFATVEDRKKAAEAGIDNYWKHALAVGDAKAWDRSLDRRLKGPGDPFTNHNPSYQIDFYLRATDLKWGVLTNGRLWRLYYRDLSYRLDVYYEVNLPELLEQGDEQFNHFAAFFAQKAFLRDEQGECFLDRAYKGSLAYATALSKDLKDNVYEALRLLTEGFLRFPGNGLTPQDMDRIRENAFVVIYRLLFILYAEDRGFLPLENRDYGGTYSLRALAKEIAQKVDGQASLSPAASGYWSRLQDLFRMIDAGDAPLSIPPYNGGLFDESRHPEVGQWKIGDSYLARAVDMLARATAAERTGRGFVSYRELSIRELGSIYEGLLEHRPRIAEEPMVVVRDDKTERVIPEREAQGKKVLGRYEPDEVYLTLHRGERKATGSYYTPDYIVKYIVANTLGPLVEEKKAEGGDLIESIQSLKVLDPAMGSGHFLVEATDFLARALVETLGGDVLELDEDDIRWARREVVERCVYGVDLNPLAVELAKLSLWLHTVSRDRPLNFLDHHLRCGNSLIGTWLKDLGQLPQPAGKGAKKKVKVATAITTLEGHGLQQAIAAAVKTFHAIAEAPTHTVQDVHTKESAYRTARHALSHIIDIADAWTSAYFGNDVDPSGYSLVLLDAYRGEADRPSLGDMPWLEAARRMGSECHFFHFELEFPEVFFDANGTRLAKPGFSAVVGNPPYVSFGLGRVGSLPAELERYYRERSPDSAEYKISTYALFMERAVSLSEPGGYSSLIVPDSFLTGSYFSKIRRLLLWDTHLQHILLFTRDFWESGEVGFPTVYCSRRLADDGIRDDLEIRFAMIAEPAEPLVEVKYSTLGQGQVRANEGYRIHLVEEQTQGKVLSKMACFAHALGTIVRLHHGIRSRVGRSKIVAGVKKGPSWKRAIVSSSEVHRFLLDPDTAFILVQPELLFSGGWDPKEVEQPKILVRRTGDRLICAVDSEGFYHTNALIYGTSTGLHPQYSLQYLAAVLNSRLMDWAYKTQSMTEGRTLPQVEIDFVHTLPIRRISAGTAQAERNRLLDDAKVLYRGTLESGHLGGVLSFVDSLLPTMADSSPDTNRERSDIVHDLLASLAEEMTQLSSERSTEAKGFLAWLEGYVGVSVDDLQNKTKVRGYYELEGGWEEFAAILDQNQRNIQRAKGIDITRREPREAIRQEHEASLARLRPLLRKIEVTDRLIDLIVYRLYGLTEEEIAIVEGRA